jgi:hypothetical protein
LQREIHRTCAFADPAAARKLMGVGQRRRAGAGARIRRRPHVYIEKINGPFLYQLRGTPYKAGFERAIAKAWLWLHESGTYVEFTEAGAAMFA